MGYDEALVYTESEKGFEKIINTYIKLNKKGFYDDPCSAEPLAVIELKKNLGGLPKGKRLLWVGGDRCFLNEYGIFSNKLPFTLPVHISPAENMFPLWGHELDGLNLNIGFSENEILKYYNISTYIRNVHKKEIRERINER